MFLFAPACVALLSYQVPIIKARLLPAASCPAVDVDISLGVANGPGAAALMRSACILCPPLRPLVLCMKALLKEAGEGGGGGCFHELLLCDSTGV